MTLADVVFVFLLLLVVGAFELYCRERRAHLRTRQTYQARLAAACDGLHACQAANEQLVAAVREREQAIGGLLQRLNAANIALKVMRDGDKRTDALMTYTVAAERFSRN